MIDGDLERRLERLSAGYLSAGDTGRSVDTHAAWRQFTRRRGRTVRNRRLITVFAAAAVVVAVAIVGFALAGHFTPGGPASGNHKRPPARRGQITITARIPQPGAGSAPGDEAIAGTITASGRQVWGITYSSDLFSVDLRTNRVSFTEHIPGLRDLASGAGAIWALTSSGAPHGRLIKIDPRTGHVVTAFPLARDCSQVSYGGGQLWIACGSSAITFLRLSPVSGQILATGGPAHNVNYAAATGAGIWYVNDSGASGFVGTGARLRWVHATDAKIPVSLGYSDSLVYGQGYLWTFTNDEGVAKIDPATGRIVRIYGYQSYDPSYSMGLDFFTVGLNSLWFLADGHAQATGVLRVSMATGRPQGQVVDAGSCGEPCWQIYAAGGSIWVPTQRYIARIQPVRLRQR